MSLNNSDNKSLDPHELARAQVLDAGIPASLEVLRRSAKHKHAESWNAVMCAVLKAGKTCRGHELAPLEWFANQEALNHTYNLELCAEAAAKTVVHLHSDWQDVLRSAIEYANDLGAYAVRRVYLRVLHKHC